MTSILKRMAVLASVMIMAACGGGGGSAGTSPFGGGSGGETGGAGGANAVTLEIQRSGAATTQISSSESVQAVAVVRDSGGNPIQGVVVTFSETGAGLLKFAPAAGTALTDSAGTAKVDVSATSPSATGATTVTVSATVSAATVTNTKAIQVTATAGGGAVSLPAAMNFVGSSPSGVAIVVKGSGGSGRSESAILTFKVVDAQNAPINDVTVAFVINTNNGGATIQPTSAKSDANGIVTTTVSSGTQPASIVVTASTPGANGVTVSTQSDTLIVSNSVPIQEGFEIVAEKYNLDGDFTGDSTKITAFVRDQFGNPVADGVAVNFTTDYGVVALSTLGGCTTLNGRCTVDFAVQDPRGSGLATVIAQINVGNTTVLVDELQINMAAGASTSYVALDPANNNLPITMLTLTSCKASVELLLSDGSGRAAAAGTTIGIGFSSTGVSATVPSGSPVLDQLAAGFPPTNFALQVDLTSTDLVTKCDPAGTVKPSTNYFRLQFKTPHNIVFEQRVGLQYPQ